ncbi:hypothetical protein ACSSVZ_001778 [Amorphus sp. MBR-141]
MWMPVRRSLAIAAFAASALAFGVGGAAAQSCSAMQSELARLSASGNGAVKSQIASLERQAVANGCRGSNSWGRPRACAGIDARLSELKRQGGGASNPARVRQLQRAIAANCAKPQPQRQARKPSQAQPARAEPARDNAGYQPDRMTTHGSVIIHGTRPDNFLGSEVKQTTGFFSTLFGRGRVERLREDGTRVEPVATDPAAKAKVERSKTAAVSGGVEGVHGIFRGGGMKTWCVRLCDGFYFPVSYSTSSSEYQRDLAICQGRCPGADVSLYSHPSYMDPEDMVSTVSGERYTKLPTAFAYRTTVSGNCGCELQTPQVKSAGAEDTEADPSAGDAVVADGEPQQTEDVQVAAFATEGDTGSATAADYAKDAASELAGLTAIGSLSDTGSASAGAPAATVARAPSDSDDTSADGTAVVDVVARPSADEPGVSEARPITEQDLNVRKVGPTYYADQIAVSAGAAQARQNAR